MHNNEKDITLPPQYMASGADIQTNNFTEIFKCTEHKKLKYIKRTFIQVFREEETDDL